MQILSVPVAGPTQLINAYLMQFVLRNVSTLLHKVVSVQRCTGWA